MPERRGRNSTFRERLALAPRRERVPQHLKSMPNQTQPNNEAGAVVQERLVRRLGSFRVSEELLRSHTAEVMKVMAECVVIRCELRYETMTFEYVAISPHFEEVPEWQIPPQYEARMEVVKTGTDEEPKWESRFMGFFPTNSHTHPPKVG